MVDVDEVARELAEVRAILRREDGRDLPLTNIELAYSVVETCARLRRELSKAHGEEVDE